LSLAARKIVNPRPVSISIMVAQHSSTNLTPAGARSGRRRILIVAGEASGDLHGADLAREIKALDPDCDLFGIAGQRMRQAGVRPLFRAEDIAGLGLTELAATLRRTIAAGRGLRAMLRRDPPALAILIDFAEFNMMLAGSARRAGVPVLYYITPQVWAWRRGRIRKLVARADRLAVVFPFESELYAAAGNRVKFVGHPLLDKIAPPTDRERLRQSLNLPAGARPLALLPGSRSSEMRYLLGPMVEAARILARTEDLLPCLALAPGLPLEVLVRELKVDLDGVRIFRNDTYNIVAASEVALVASGTATLETALLNCPMVIAYKMAPLTYLLARLLITGVEHIGMPNILAGERIVPELIQSEVTGPNLAAAAGNLLREPRHSETVAALRAIRARLGAPGAASRVAALALEMTA